MKGMNYFYSGAGKKSDGPRFIVIEDASHTHAGALRHRLWSDGVTEAY